MSRVESPGGWKLDTDRVNVRDALGVDERWVAGDGSPTAQLVYVAEAPGMHEIRAKRPLIGPSGEINWQFAQRYGHVVREGTWRTPMILEGGYVTNWHKTPFTDFDKKHITEDESRQWTELLEEELAAIAPRVVITLGGYATASLLGEGHSLFWANGIPFQRRQGDFIVIPVVHPAAGMHDSDMLARTSAGYEGVREFLEGRVQPRLAGAWNASPPTRVLRRSDIATLPKNVRAVAIDTEGSPARPFCLTFSISPEEAFLIYADDKETLVAWVEWMEGVGVIVLHNSIYDATVIRNMSGLNVWDWEVRDTMVAAFNLQNLPLGLKPLTMRELNIHMDEYEDVVRPWQEKADDEWREKGYAAALPLLALEQQFTPTGKPRMSKGQPVYKWAGPELQQNIRRHHERRQNISIAEEKWIEQTIGSPRPGMDLHLVPPADHIPYAGRDSAVTSAHELRLWPRIKAEGLEAVCDLDHAVLPMIEDMQNTGLHIDLEQYWGVLGDISIRKSEVTREIQEMVANEFPGHRWSTGDGEIFNPASGDQVAEFCRQVYMRDGRLGLTKLTKGGTRESVDDSVLSPLREDHPFIPLELEFKELDKYEGTYLLPLQPLIREVRGQYYVYTHLRTTSVVSGRLSAHGPNVLAWPARTKLGLRIRSIFTAPDGYVLASWDLSQVELRIAASLSKDPILVETFVNGLDPHTNLATKLFPYTYEQISNDSTLKQLYRTPAKNINYMLLYGGGPGKLWEMMGGRLSRTECEEMYVAARRAYRVVLRWLREAGTEARAKGFVTDILGRRRFLPGTRLVGDTWPSLPLRLESERQGGNFKIQGAQAELIKRAMVTTWEMVYPESLRKGWGLRFWLQVHDELFGQVREEHFPEVDKVMREVLTQDSWMYDPIKIETDGKYGHSWADLKG